MAIVLPFSPWLLALPVCFILYRIYVWRTSASAGDEKQLPQPKSYPIVGNVLGIPREKPWIKFGQWGEELGPIYKLNILGQTHVVLSDDKIAQTLLGERGLQYSDRPWFNFASGLLTGNLHILLVSYNGLLMTSNFQYRNLTTQTDSDGTANSSIPSCPTQLLRNTNLFK
jgi:hypothetical protein